MSGGGEWRCPACNGDNTQRVNVLFASGLGASLGGGVAADRTGNVGAGFAVGLRASLLSLAMMPPREPKISTLWPSVGGATAFVIYLLFAIPMGQRAEQMEGIFLGLVGSLLEFLVFMGFTLPIFVYLWIAHRLQSQLEESELPKYRAAMARWQRQVFCRRCGQVFDT